jgi:hypothetical protein
MTTGIGAMKAPILLAFLCTSLGCEASPTPGANDSSALGSRSVRASTPPTDTLSVPVGWSSVPPPAPESEEARCANWSREAWKVSADGKKLLILADSGEKSADTVAVPGGKLTSIDHGEFGGQVWWEPTDGRRTKIAETNLLAFASTEAGLFGLAGLAHLSINEGELVRFDRVSAGTWRIQHVSDLHGAPYAFTILPNRRILVVTSGALVEASLEGTVHTLHQNRVWSFTYPRSVVQDGSGTVYIGMRSAVARLTSEGGRYREDWLVPPNCPKRRSVGSSSECACVANNQR